MTIGPERLAPPQPPAVELREVREDDIPIFFEHQCDPAALAMAAFSARGKDEFIAHWTKLLGDPGVAKMTILHRGEVAGNVVGFDRLGKSLVGYWVGREHWGRGVATQALARFLAQFETRPLHAYVAKQNVGSLRVLQKCGFSIIAEESPEDDGTGTAVTEYLLQLDPPMDGAGRIPERTLRAAIFDMDGLLLDSERPIRDAWLAAAQARGLPLTEQDYLRVVGVNHADSRAILCELLGGESIYDSLCAEAGGRIAAAGFAAKRGARALLSLLALRGVPLAIASSTHRAEIFRRLDAAGLVGYVDSVTGGDEVRPGRGKPMPDIYLLAAERLGIDPAACVVFEDSDAGATAAIAAGMPVVVVPDLKQPSEAVRKSCALVLESLDHALARCDAWFGMPPVTR